MFTSSFFPFRAELAEAKKRAKTYKERKKHDRFDGMPEEEVSKRVLPDHLANNLDIIIVSLSACNYPVLVLASSQHDPQVIFPLFFIIYQYCVILSSRVNFRRTLYISRI